MHNISYTVLLHRIVQRCTVCRSKLCTSGVRRRRVEEPRPSRRAERRLLSAVLIISMSISISASISVSISTSISITIMTIIIITVIIIIIITIISLGHAI